jgi:hypothetical protein
MSESESEIVATFTVSAGTTIEFSMDTADMDDRQIIREVEFASGDYADTNLCHECESRIVDPEMQEMTGLSVDGREIDLDGPR